MHFFDEIGKYDDAIAVITEASETVSYRTIVAEADSFAQNLGARSLVFVVCRNNLESVVGYIGCLRRRAVPVLISDNIDQEFFDSLLDLYRPEFIWLPSDRADERSDCATLHSFGGYVLLGTSYEIDYGLHDELAILLTTSGSTGSPKLVRLTYENINSNTESIVKYLRIKATDRPITTLPMAYTFGLSIINTHLSMGCAIVLTDKTLMNKGIWELLKAQEVTTFGGVPYTYEMLKKLRFFSMELPSLQILTQAGGKLGRELSEEFAIGCDEKGVSFIVMYGQTEATARMSYLPREHAITKAGSIGIAIPGGEFWLEDESGSVVEDNDTVGELVYRGTNVCAGYALSRSDLCREDENRGVLRTGDVAKRDADGCYYVVGRKRRFLKLFGNRVNLDEVEQILKSAGHDCACTGDDKRMRIFVTSKDRHRAIKKYIAERTKINPAGFAIEHVAKIPRNDAGKALYYLLDRK